MSLSFYKFMKDADLLPESYANFIAKILTLVFIIRIFSISSNKIYEII